MAVNLLSAEECRQMYLERIGLRWARNDIAHWMSSHQTEMNQSCLMFDNRGRDIPIRPLRSEMI